MSLYIYELIEGRTSVHVRHYLPAHYVDHSSVSCFQIDTFHYLAFSNIFAYCDFYLKESHHAPGLGSPTVGPSRQVSQTHNGNQPPFASYGSRSDLNKHANGNGAAMRTPNQRNNNGASQQPPPPPIYQPASAISQQQQNQQHYDMSNAVSSIVDTWEADLAKHVKRRPSGQLDQCIFRHYSLFNQSL